jgi:sugar phosphate isomerase/epimerase
MQQSSASYIANEPFRGQFASKLGWYSRVCGQMPTISNVGINNAAAITRRQLLTNAAKAAGIGVAASCLPLRVRDVQAETAAMPLKFKYAICNEPFGAWPCEKTFAFAAKCGYTGIEIAPFTLAPSEKGTGTIYGNGPERASQQACLSPFPISAARRAEIRKMAKRAGLEVVGLHWLLAKTTGFHLTSPDAAVRRKTAQYFGELANLCADLGGRIMVLGSPQQRNLAPGMTKAQGMKFAAEVLQAVAPTLEKAKVVIALEPLAAVETNFLTSAAEGAELVALVDSPTCRLHLDCKAMAGEQGAAGLSPTEVSARYIPALIHQFRRLFVHFHANDPNRQGPGFGKLDFVPIMKALAEVKYRGWVSVEPIDLTPGAERLARESIDYLRRCVAKNES